MVKQLPSLFLTVIGRETHSTFTACIHPPLFPLALFSPHLVLPHAQVYHHTLYFNRHSLYLAELLSGAQISPQIFAAFAPSLL